MDAYYPTDDEPATSEYVLAVIQDYHRHQCQHDPEAEPTDLTFDSTVAEWRQACDLLPWREVGHAYNSLFRIDCPDAEWKAVLEPACTKRLSDVCGLVATHARRPRVRPARLFGANCQPTGVFLTVRSLLHQLGENPSDIAPSTPLAEYTRRHVHFFLEDLPLLAPGALPPVRIWQPVYDVSLFIFLVIGLALCVLGNCIESALGIIGVAMFVVGYLLTWVGSRVINPQSVTFGELKTFRDLSLALTSRVGTHSSRP